MDRSQLRTLAVDIYKEILGLNEDDMALLEEDRLDIRDDRYLNVNMWEEGDTLVEEDTSDDPGMLTTAVFLQFFTGKRNRRQFIFSVTI